MITESSEDKLNKPIVQRGDTNNVKLNVVLPIVTNIYRQKNMHMKKRISLTMYKNM